MMGVLDIAAPLLALIHGWLMPWMPAAIEIALWAIVCAGVSMGLYRAVSRQQRLKELKGQVRSATLELAEYDGDFSGMLDKVGTALRLTMQQLWLTLLPAILASLPVLFVLTWLSNTFEYALPRSGQLITVTVTPADAELSWIPAAAATRTGKATWQLAWPALDHPLTVRDRNDIALASLPLSAPIPVLHKRIDWNWLIGNPAGYLPGNAAVDTLALSLPALDVIPFGPAWLRHWMSLFLAVLVSVSLWLKMKWKLA